LLGTAEKQAAREHWPAATGTVIVSRALAACANPAKYFPDLRYRFAAAGGQYIGSKIDGVDLDIKVRQPLQVGAGSLEVDFPTTQNRCVSADQAAALVARYQVGSSPAVYYNPRAPYEAILVKTGVTVSIWTEFVAVAIVALALALVALIYLRVATGLGKSRNTN